MESSIAEFRMRQSACELLPTTTGQPQLRAVIYAGTRHKMNECCFVALLRACLRALAALQRYCFVALLRAAVLR